MKKCMVVFGVVIGMMVSLQVNAQSYYEYLADYYNKVALESLQKEICIGIDSSQSMSRIVTEYTSLREKNSYSKGDIQIPDELYQIFQSDSPWLIYGHKIDSKEVQFNVIKEKQAQLEKRICNLQNELITDIILDVIKILLLIVIIVLWRRRSIKKK